MYSLVYIGGYKSRANGKMKLLLTILLCTLGCVAYAIGQTTEKPKVIRLVDGDTFTVLTEGKYETVRMIGINAPEFTKVKECYGKESTDKLKELIDGKEVKLEADPTQADKDKYGRLLRYVFLNDSNINLYLIAEGYAKEYTYSKAYKYQDEFKKAQTKAVASKKGMWSGDNCPLQNQ